MIIKTVVKQPEQQCQCGLCESKANPIKFDQCLIAKFILMKKDNPSNNSTSLKLQAQKTQPTKPSNQR